MYFVAKKVRAKLLPKISGVEVAHCLLPKISGVEVTPPVTSVESSEQFWRKICQIWRICEPWIVYKKGRYTYGWRLPFLPSLSERPRNFPEKLKVLGTPKQKNSNQCILSNQENNFGSKNTNIFIYPQLYYFYDLICLSTLIVFLTKVLIYNCNGKFFSPRIWRFRTQQFLLVAGTSR